MARELGQGAQALVRAWHLGRGARNIYTWNKRERESRVVSRTYGSGARTSRAWAGELGIWTWPRESIRLGRFDLRRGRRVLKDGCM